MAALVWPVGMYGCESWTLKATDKRKITAFELTAYRRLLRVSWREHRTNASILEELQPKQRLLAEVQRRKLNYFGHIVRAQNLSTHMLHGRIDGKRPRGRPRRRWTDDIKQWTGRPVEECIRTAQDRHMWRKLVQSSIASDLQA